MNHAIMPAATADMTAAITVAWSVIHAQKVISLYTTDGAEMACVFRDRGEFGALRMVHPLVSARLAALLHPIGAVILFLG